MKRFFFSLFPFVSLAFLFFSFLLFTSCRNNYRFIEENREESGEFLYIKNFRRSMTDADSRSLWTLEGDKAFLFQEGLGASFSRMIAYGFRFRNYDGQKKPRFFLSAKRGDWNNLDQKLLLAGEVFWKDAKNLEAKSEEMQYDFQKRLLTSKVPVLLQRMGSRTVCRKGVVIDLEGQKQSCKSPKAQVWQAKSKSNFPF